MSETMKFALGGDAGKQEKLLMGALVVFVVAIVAVGGWYLFKGIGPGDPIPDTETFQCVKCKALVEIAREDIPEEKLRYPDPEILRLNCPECNKKDTLVQTIECPECEVKFAPLQYTNRAKYMRQGYKEPCPECGAEISPFD